MPRRRRAFSEQEIIDIVLARINGVRKRGRWPTNRELANQFERSESQISRAWTTALAKGLLRISVPQTSLKTAKRLRGLEDHLLEKFRHQELRDAIVIKGHASAVPQGSRSFGHVNDGMHLNLGLAMAEF